MNKINLIKQNLNEKLWTDRQDKIVPYLTEQRGNLKGVSSLLLKPRNTQDVVNIVKICNEYKVPIVPQGGRTGLCGGTIPNKQGNEVILSTELMNKIININKDNYYLIAQSGCTLHQIKKFSEKNKRYFPLSLPSQLSCTIGGNISTNAGGSEVLKYGMTKSFIEGLKVVLPNGKILNSIKEIKKDNRGFDPKYLHIGSEGTLGIITEVKLKLYPEIKNKEMAIVAVKSIKKAIDFLNLVKNKSLEFLSAFEINSDYGMNLIRKYYNNIDIPFNNEYPWYIIFELTSSQKYNLKGKIDEILELSYKKKFILNAIQPLNLRQYNNIWKTREFLSEAQKLNGKSIKHDISIPIDKIPFFLDKVEEKLKVFKKITLLTFGHLADGNIHFNVSQSDNLNKTEFNKLKKMINMVVFDLVYSIGGSFSAEHGIGKIKKNEFKKYSSKEEFMIKRNIKKILDPNNIMNPGKIFN